MAGIDLETGQWVRPVPKGAKAIPDVATHFRAHDLMPLDVVELEVTPPKSPTKYQRENQVVTSSHWTLVGTLKVEDVIRYCEKSPTILHSSSKVVDPADLELLPPEKWHSLELRRVTNAKFIRDKRKKDKWVVSFSVPKSVSFSFSLTDPIATEKLNKGRVIGPNCLLTLSLTEPIAYQEFDLPELCYKLAAAVIEI